MGLTTSGWGVRGLAAELGVNPRTVRYYERIGLLTASARTNAGYRRYGPTERDRLRFILKAKAVGLALDEVRDVLSMRDKGMTPCAHVRALIEEKLRQLDRHVQSLLEFREELVALRREAESEPVEKTGCVCGLLEHHQPQHDGATIRLATQILARRPGDRRHV
jgi:DNA-binding transcriptional MerR regulator